MTAVMISPLSHLPRSLSSLSLSSSLTFRPFHTCIPLMGGKDRTLRQDFRVLREPPLGPHKLLPPGKKIGNRIGPKGNYRFIPQFPEDNKYTIRPLPIQKLGGRDIVTGRKVIEGCGGGSKQKYRWVDWLRIPADWPKDVELVERVVAIKYDPLRTSYLALTGYDDKLRWQIATENMKEGDLIYSTTHIPANPVKPMEGNSHPLGALPVGSIICLVQQLPDSLWVEVRKGEEKAEILRKIGDRVIVKSSNGLEYSYDETCQCVVGVVSIHPLKKCDIGSPNRLRWLGFRPRSGLWQRKTGHDGRKIRRPPPVKEMLPEKEETNSTTIVMHADTEGKRGFLPSKKRPFTRVW